MSDEPVLIVENSRRGIVLHAADAWRNQAMDLMEQTYKAAWEAIVPIWNKCERSAGPMSEWIPVPKLSAKQRVIYLSGVRAELAEMIDDITIGGQQFCYASNLINEWVGGTVTQSKANFADDIEKLKNRLKKSS